MSHPVLFGVHLRYTTTTSLEPTLRVDMIEFMWYVNVGYRYWDRDTEIVVPAGHLGLILRTNDYIIFVREAEKLFWARTRNFLRRERLSWRRRFSAECKPTHTAISCCRVVSAIYFDAHCKTHGRVFRRHPPRTYALIRICIQLFYQQPIKMQPKPYHCTTHIVNV